MLAVNFSSWCSAWCTGSEPGGRDQSAPLPGMVTVPAPEKVRIYSWAALLHQHILLPTFQLCIHSTGRCDTITPELAPYSSKPAWVGLVYVVSSLHKTTHDRIFRYQHNGMGNHRYCGKPQCKLSCKVQLLLALLQVGFHDCITGSTENHEVLQAV